jgi:endoglucanase
MADAYVRDGTYAGTNFGSDPTLYAKSSTGSSVNRESYLTFDLTQLGNVGSATLRLYGALNTADDLDISLYDVPTTGWTEAGITWNNRPASGTTAVATQHLSSTAFGWYAFDITAWLQQQKAAGKTSASLAIKSDTLGTSAFAKFNSTEAGVNGPQLVVAG